jgi:glycosylphosphatidylinositol transamidase
MGLLTSDRNEKTSVLAKLLTKHYGKLSLLSYLIGLTVCGLLLLESERTYFSDNALLPGLVQREFTLSQLANETLQALNKVSDNYIENQIPYEWIISQFKQIGLEVYKHNFTLNYPFGSKPVNIIH